MSTESTVFARLTRSASPEGAIRMDQLRSLILSTMAQGLSADLAISPVVVTSLEPGIGRESMISGVARGLSCGFITIRCDMLDRREFTPHHVMVAGGAVELRTPRIKALADEISNPQCSIVLLEASGDAVDSVLPEILGQIQTHAQGPVVVVVSADVYASADAEDRALRVISDVLGIHRAHVPTCRLSMDLKRPLMPSPILLSGRVSSNGCRTGEQYLEIDTSTPYDHTVRFTLYQGAEQSDGEFFDLLGDAIEDGETFVRLELVDGDLRCGVSDMTKR